jgi:hypothetical protein
MRITRQKAWPASGSPNKMLMMDHHGPPAIILVPDFYFLALGLSIISYSETI